MAEPGSTDNFPQAARRHWHDAQLLFEKQRLGNADQLFGLAAECALKAAFAAQGHLEPAKLGGPKAVHLPAAWSSYVSALESREAGQSPLLAFDDCPFDDWSIGHRYAADGAIPSLEQVSRHIRACQACFLEMSNAEVSS
jgi:hypothetical protein